MVMCSASRNQERSVEDTETLGSTMTPSKSCVALKDLWSLVAPFYILPSSTYYSDPLSEEKGNTDRASVLQRLFFIKTVCD